MKLDPFFVAPDCKNIFSIFSINIILVQEV